jgi:hypothetical protein
MHLTILAHCLNHITPHCFAAEVFLWVPAAPVIHHTVLFNGQVRVAASVGSCQLAHSGAATLADVVEANGAALGPLYMV